MPTSLPFAFLQTHVGSAPEAGWRGHSLPSCPINAEAGPLAGDSRVRARCCCLARCFPGWKNSPLSSGEPGWLWRGALKLQPEKRQTLPPRKSPFPPLTPCGGGRHLSPGSHQASILFMPQLICHPSLQRADTWGLYYATLTKAVKLIPTACLVPPSQMRPR